MKKPVLYLWHGLTHASDAFIQRMRLFREDLRERYDILDFLGFGLGTPADVYVTDSACVEQCDVFVAECSHTSLGLGIELQIAANHNKPTLVLHERGVKVSRMALGIPNPNQEVRGYDTTEEATAAVRAFVSKHTGYGE